MHPLRPILRYLVTMSFLVVVACCACIYTYSYSIHQVIVLPYDAFDTVPDADGTVTLEAGRAVIDFRLPDSTFSRTTIAELQDRLADPSADDFEWMVRCVGLVRSRLNATDATRPKARSMDAEHLYRNGMDEYCLCSEHAILLNEILQLFQRQARVLWLEGHVATEYLDRDLNKWVFVDAHMNLLFVDSSQTPMSAAEVIYATERGLPLHVRPICAESDQAHSFGIRDIDRLWYRNILLNGECYALSGTTLREPSRWTHLIRFHRRPQILTLSTSYDTSTGKYLEPFELRKSLLFFLAIVLGHYLLTYAGRAR
ncbi:MAG: hypothetical protein EA424_25340 [Planctomycetaceae bacterium]|nr:MAG: hypothetical protein EA424_25340 [Planctomycetaceae bacterium]